MSTVRFSFQLKCFAAIAVFSFCSAVPAAENDRWLLPTPKKVQWENEVLNYPASGYRFEDESGIMPRETCQWLKEGLLQKLGWKECPESKLCIRIRKTPGNGNPEYYILQTTKTAIRLEAPGKAGIVRAVGRLLCIADTPLVRVLKGGIIQYPGITIHDWPDYPFRGMLLELSCRKASPEWIPNFKQMIDAMGKLGFNHVAFEIGGRIESLRHPEVCKKPWWTQQQIKDFIAYANARGMKAIPAINSIGHASRAPDIFPLQYTRENGKKTYVMDLAHREFYPVYFDFLDEVHKLFGNPEWFMIGTDEFHEAVPLLEKTTGKSLPAFYSEFLNKVHAHLKGKGTKTVIWHDMLADRSDNTDEPRNGSAETLDLIDKNIVIAYWNYSFQKKYPFLETLLQKKFREIWICPWKGIAATARLTSEGVAQGISHLMGTCWWDQPHYLGFPEIAESAWHANTRRPQREMDAFKDVLFYAEETKIPLPDYAALSEVQGGSAPYPEFMERLRKSFPDGKMQLNTFQTFITPYAFSTPEDIPKQIPESQILKEILHPQNQKTLFLSTDSSREWIEISERVRTNVPREAKQLVIYTPEYGKTTRTNQWGTEFALIGGVITKTVKPGEAKGNMSIPGNGVVFSKHGRYSSLQRAMSFQDSLEEGRRIILRRSPRNNPSLQTLTIPLNGAKRFILLFATACPMSMERILAEFHLQPVNGKRITFTLNTRNFFNGQFNPGSSRRMWLAYPEGIHAEAGPVLALQWHPGKNIPLEQLKIIPRKDAAFSGLVFLGGIKY